MGEALIDLKPDVVAGGDAAGPGQRRLIALSGGSPANTAVALARLGTTARLAARLWSDPFGRMLREHLNANGVDLTYSVNAGEPATYSGRVEEWVTLADLVKVSEDDMRSRGTPPIIRVLHHMEPANSLGPADRTS